MSTIGEVARVRQRATSVPLSCDMCGKSTPADDVREWADKPQAVANWISHACAKCRERYITNYRPRPQPRKLDRWKSVELS